MQAEAQDRLALRGFKSRRHSSLAATALITLVVASSVAEGARPVRFETLGLEQGLSQTQSFFVFQDSVGFIWIGSEKGLNRYDGYRIDVFFHDPSDPESLPDDFTWSMSEDRSGDLWIATEGGGVARWRRSDATFGRYRNDPEDPTSLSSNRTRCVWVDGDGSVWVGTRDQGLDRLDPGTGRAEHFRHDPQDPSSLRYDAVFALYGDRSGRLWVGTDAGLDLLDPRTGRFEHIDTRPEGHPDRVRAITEDGSGRIWLGTQGNGLLRLGPDDREVRRFRHQPGDPASLSHDIVRSVLADKAGRLWVATGDGLDLMREDGGFDRYRHEVSDPHSLPDSNVISLYQDRGGVLWVGTQYGGVSRWNPATWSFGHHSAGATGLSGNSISAFAQDGSGSVWVGTYGEGLNRLDPGSGAVEHFRHEPGDPGSLSDDSISALYFDDEHETLWIGTRGGGLNERRRGRAEFRVYRQDPASAGALSADAITTLSGDGGGGLWIGTFGGGLNHLDSTTGRFSAYRGAGHGAQSLSHDTILAIATEPSGGVWLGTYGGGLNHLDPTTGQIRYFRRQEDDPSSLSNDTIYALHLDDAGTLWIGTRGAGLDRLAYDDGAGEARFRNYSTRDGLPNGDVFGIEPDDSGNLWLSTNGGLCRFDPRSGAFQTFRPSSGLQSTEFNFGAHYRSPDGQLFFGGINGFNAFYPDRLERNTHAPPVVLTAFLKLNRPVELGRPLSQLDEVVLAYRDDVVTFEFAALDFAAPEANRYRYRLVGFDKEWVDAGDVRRVTYTNLDPGQYSFRVVASNNDGVWSQEGLRLPIAVEPPPWRTWWAYTVYVALSSALLAATGLSLQRRIRRLTRQVHEAQKLGQYTLGEKIGEGAMGAVYRAQHAFLRRPTAIKLLQPHKSRHIDLRRFEREAQLTSQLTHPNTVAIFDYGQTADGQLYYAMEFLEGLNLQQLVRASGPVPPRRTVFVLKQIALALKEAHSIGLVHRDVKPANVILCQRWGSYDVVKVVDFGLAREITPTQSNLTADAVIVGTPDFIAPEAVQSPDSVDGRSDIYSLGALSYYLLAGRPPFEAATAIEIIRKHVETPPPPLTEAPEAVPSALERLVFDCLQKRPSRRPQNAADVVDRLDGIEREAGVWTQADARKEWLALPPLKLAGVSVTDGRGDRFPPTIELGGGATQPLGASTEVPQPDSQSE